MVEEQQSAFRVLQEILFSARPLIATEELE